MCSKSFRINNEANIKPLKRRERNQNLKKGVCLPQGGCRSSTPPSPHPPVPSQQAVPLRRPRLFYSRSFSCFGGGEGTYPSSANMGSRQSLVLRSVRFAVVLGALQLHLQPLHADLEAVHRLDGCLCRHWIVIADEACRGQQTQRRAREKHANRS